MSVDPLNEPNNIKNPINITIPYILNTYDSQLCKPIAQLLDHKQKWRTQFSDTNINIYNCKTKWKFRTLRVTSVYHWKKKNRYSLRWNATIAKNLA